MAEPRSYKKPLPRVDEESRGYWEALARHELYFQRCRDCGTERARVEPLGAAVATSLEVELVARERLPVAARLLVEAGHVLRVGGSFRFAHGLPRISVTPL